jgi:thiamine monophosphate synthase
VKMMTAAGARRFVVVRYLTEAEDPKAAAKTLREAIKKAVGAA